MTDKNTHKLNIGPLPEQVEDYSHYEESELRWDRILVVLVILSALVFGLYSLFSSDKSEEKAVASQVVNASESSSSSPVSKEEAASSSEQEQESEVVVSKTSSAPKVKPEPKTKVDNSSKQVIDKVVEKEDLVKEPVTKKVAVIEPKTNPVRILRDGIAQAQLTSSLKDGRPVDELGSPVIMNQDGIIKVVLYTEMTNLKGTWLRHIWYRNDVKQATIKVPVNYDSQRSSSSKFINAQMLGDWRVDVLDDAQGLYAQANFKVLPN